MRRMRRAVAQLWSRRGRVSNAEETGRSIERGFVAGNRESVAASFREHPQKYRKRKAGTKAKRGREVKSISTDLIPAVGYIRMSTDKQEDSPARQRAEIQRYAKANGIRITEWYEDHGLTGTESMNRPEFQRLLADAAAGRFTTIVVSEHSRLSREDIFAAMQHWKIFHDAGVTVHSILRGEVRFDLGGFITLFVDQHGAHDESVKLAHRTTSGKILKAKAGHRLGKGLFAMDRVYFDESGKQVHRVHYREHFSKPTGWRQSLDLSADANSLLKNCLADKY